MRELTDLLAMSVLVLALIALLYIILLLDAKTTVPAPVASNSLLLSPEPFMPPYKGDNQ